MVSESGIRGFKRQALSLTQDDLVTTANLSEAPGLPVLQPKLTNIDPETWIAGHRSRLTDLRTEFGGVLLRGFGIDSAETFQRVMSALDKPPMAYLERSSPRKQVSAQVYTSTEYPADQTIPLHNENSYANVWPCLLGFFCLKQAEAAGETPLADCRRVLQRLSTELVENFRRKQVLYVRNYGELGLSWQEVFGTTDREEATAYCRQAGYTVEWLGGDRLRTRRLAPPVLKHPITGEAIWFNHAAFFHITTMEPATRQALLDQFKVEDLPYNTYFGDGTVISDMEMEEIRAAYAACTIKFTWVPGDLLLLDNMLMAHGRSPFRGPRRVLVSLLDPMFSGSAQPV